MSRELTEEECRKQFLDQVRTYIDHWSHKNTSVEDKLKGLAFSIMVILDGGTNLPGFAVIPYPHEDDRQFCIDNNINWWPDGVDISGSLHEELGT
jgi:hypothetical protein